jgi:hypothetical protein
MYTQSIVAGLLSIAALTSAAPLTARTQSGTYPPTNGTSTSPSAFLTTGTVSPNLAPSAPSSPPAASTPASPYGQQPIAAILPDFTSQYTVSTGAVDFHTSRGLVSRFPQNGGNDITTLVTFELPQQYANNQCQLVFDLGGDYSSSVSGTGQAQLFTSLAPASARSKPTHTVVPLGKPARDLEPAWRVNSLAPPSRARFTVARLSPSEMLTTSAGLLASTGQRSWSGDFKNLACCEAL